MFPLAIIALVLAVLILLRIAYVHGRRVGYTELAKQVIEDVLPMLEQTEAICNDLAKIGALSSGEAEELRRRAGMN